MDWLPALQPFAGDWSAYVDDLYDGFRSAFMSRQPALFRGTPVRLKNEPWYKGKSNTFWHLTSEGQDETNRQPDVRRCERLRWPLRIIELASVFPSPILSWNQTRSTSRGLANRIVLSLPDFSYIVVLDERPSYFMLWTAFPVDEPHGRAKRKREFQATK